MPAHEFAKKTKTGAQDLADDHAAFAVEIATDRVGGSPASMAAASR